MSERVAEMKTMLAMLLVVCLGLCLPANASISAEDKYIEREVGDDFNWHACQTTFISHIH